MGAIEFARPGRYRSLMDFRTERLTAERLCAGHLAELTALLDPEVSRFLGGMRSPAETAAYLRANRVHWRQHGHGLWVALWRARRLSASLIGIASLENAASRRVLDKAGFAYERDAAYHGEAVALYRMGLEGP